VLGIVAIVFFVVVCFILTVCLSLIPPHFLGILVPIGLLFIFVGAEKRGQKALAQLNESLISEENVIASSFQKRPFSLFHRRFLVAVTNSRVIMIKRGIFGGFDNPNFQWRDLKAVTFAVNSIPSVGGANIKFTHGGVQGLVPFVLKGMDVKSARAVYTCAQSEEQAWREKHRVRTMEEDRAKSGGFNNGPSPYQPAEVRPVGNRKLDDLKQAKELLDSGAISDAEYNEMKSKILATG
jgi:hypothetical protein